MGRITLQWFALSLVFLLFPIAAWSEYDQGAIRDGISEHRELFYVDKWKLSDNAEAWLPSEKVEGVVLSVGKNNAGMIMYVEDSQQAVFAMARCLQIGAIGLAPKDEEQRGKIGEVVKQAAVSHESRFTVMNGVKFEVTPVAVGGNAFLSCILSPNPSADK
jgi:hypothetical protein